MICARRLRRGPSISTVVLSMIMLVSNAFAIDDLSELINHINQRSLNALSKTEGKPKQGLDVQTTIAVQLLREYGYGANTIIWNGDGEIILKAFKYTQKCVQRKLIKSNGDIVAPSGALADPVAAKKLFLEMFTSEEKAVLQYEVTHAKMPNGDEKRRELLKLAGYDASAGLRLTDKW